MERESTKHGRLLDEELAHEAASVVQGAPVAGHSREERRQEDPDEGLDLAGDARPDVAGRVPLEPAEATARAELARCVASARFPADRHELLVVAEANGADGTVLGELARLDPDDRFENVQTIWDALGGHHERRDAGPTR